MSFQNNLPFPLPGGDCPCSDPRSRRPGGRGMAVTTPCGNVGYSPIDCGDCCIIPEPPYDPAPIDMTVPPICDEA